MPTKNGNSIDSIAEHVSTLNKELGEVKIDMRGVKNDIHWLKRIIGYQAALITGLTIAVLGAVAKYIFLS